MTIINIVNAPKTLFAKSKTRRVNSKRKIEMS